MKSYKGFQMTPQNFDFSDLEGQIQSDSNFEVLQHENSAR